MDSQAIIPVHATPTQRGFSAKLVKAGIVGLGASARVLARAAAKSDKLKIIAGFSRSEEERRAFQVETRVPVVSDLRTLLSYPMLDGVIVALPSEQHLMAAREIARAKKHLYVESPIAATLEEGLEIASLEQQHGITVTVAHIARLVPGIRRIREAIEKGELGEIGLIEANFSGPFEPGKTSAYGQRSNEGNINSALAAFLTQQFDVLRYLGGEIAEAGAISSELSPQSDAGAHAQSVVGLKFADGKLGYVGSCSTSPGVFSVRVHGSKALIHYETDLASWNNPEKLHERSTLYVQRREEGHTSREIQAIEEANVFRAALEIFAECCRSGRSSDLAAANANSALAVAAAAERSINNRGQTVSIRDVLRQAEARTREKVLA